MASARRDRTAPHVLVQRERSARPRHAGAAAAEGDADRRRPATSAPIAGREEAGVSIGGGIALRPADLGAHLARSLAPLYVVHGDEPLAAIEAADAIRAAARRAGCDEREVFIVEQHFRWDAFVAANANLGLFGSRKLIDLRIASGKPGTEGAQALERHARSLDPDGVTLITLPRADRTMQASAWFAALADAGATVAVT